ncbi:MAG: YbjN domain-containing protein [Leptolyngbya sp. SIO3F4]|nr:YbjN domain-containing protein [Leptolyngbya sp. SIO3F4]
MTESIPLTGKGLTMTTAPLMVQTYATLNLLTPSEELLTVQVVGLKLVKSKDVINECHISFQVPFKLYQHIVNKLFHLKSELLSPTSDSVFNPNTPIEITASLQPQLLLSLPKNTTEPDAIINYLVELSQSLLDKDISSEHFSTENGTSFAEDSIISSPVIQTNSWFALYVKQQQQAGEVSYRTFWSYLSPTLLAKEVASNGQISTTMGSLFQNLAKQDEATAEAAISEAFDTLLQGLDSWVDDQLSSTEETFTQLANEISQAFDSWLAPDSTTDSSPSPSKQPIYRTMLTFFSDDDWAFTKLKGESTLQLGFENEHGRWNCYAVARDNESQFLFYSIYPTTVPEHQRSTITEYLTRANYGIVQGNFDFDFDSGEIRYKTSLDTTYLSINSKAIQQLVYTNVTIMGHYLPGILAILEKEITATAAMQLLEE